MKVYLAGPMRGKELGNQKEFLNAAEGLTLLGHEVQTPFDANNAVWQRRFQRDFDVAKDKCEYGDPVLAEMFAEDIKVLAWADAIVMLRGWEGSEGTLTELRVAKLLCKKVFEQTREGLFVQITDKITATVTVRRIP